MAPHRAFAVAASLLPGLLALGLSASAVPAHSDSQQSPVPSTLGAGGSTTPAPVALGPYARFVGPNEVTLHWHTSQDSPSIVEFGETALLGTRVTDPAPKQRHAVTLTGLKRRVTYYYAVRQLVGTQETPTPTWELEPDANLAVRPAPQLPSPYPEDEWSARYASLAQALLDTTGVTQGYCLDYGCGDGRLGYELARRSHLFVVGVTEDAEAVERGRQALRAAGVYGSRVTLMPATLTNLTHTKDSFNLVVSSELLSRSLPPGQASEVERVLRPAGGVAFFGYPAALSGTVSNWAALDSWLRAGLSPDRATLETDAGRWAKVTRAPLTGAGEWSHAYGDPGQTANSHDQRINGPGMKLQWFGQPGPRVMTDRQSRNPTPLTVNGFLYVQGNNRLFSLDAYNGSVYWALEIPQLRRVNIPRDCGNMCADAESLCVAVRNQCWRLQARSGDLIQSYQVLLPGSSPSHDWGYVATVSNRLYGSAVKSSSVYTNFDGPAYWYDSTSTDSTAKVCSDNLFCLSQESGQLDWSYARGVIINSSIAIGGGRVCFVESRNAVAQSQASGRIAHNALWLDQFLVALDAATGALLWEKPVSFPASPFPMVFYLCYADERLVVVDSTSRYYVYAYAAENGQLLWEKNHAWNRDNHGGHIYHPVITRGTVYQEPYAYDLATGNVVRSGIASRGGCSTMSGAANALVYINWDYDKGSFYFWDLVSDTRRALAGSRGSCWISLISGSGMALIPTASSGCTCRYPLQTSIGFSAP